MCCTKSSFFLRLLIICLFALISRSVRASDLDDKDFSLRFPAALSRFASYGDVAAVGGASAASKWGSSINPASADWLAREQNVPLSVNPQYSFLRFEEGTHLHVASLTPTFNLKDWGSLQPTVAVVRSNETAMKTGLDFDFEMEHYQLQWGKRLEDWGFGLNLNYAPSETRFDYGSAPVARTDSDSYGVRAGGLAQCTEKLRAGLVLDYGLSDSDTVYYDFMNFGFGDVKTDDTSHQYAVRPGLSYEYKKDSAVFLDYQFFHIRNDYGDLHASRLLMGIDHELVDGFFVRTGGAFDEYGNAAVTGGVGIYPTDWLTLDIGYQYNMFPELEPEFGRAHSLVCSLGVAF